jgi:2-phospho-L-lactate transferase/gluconeogenesis factor (CofD/UPF0052 family)
MGSMIAALADGVGGAKLADGLPATIGHDLAVVVNTADDFEHLGLHVSPDVDTVMYSLGGIVAKHYRGLVHGLVIDDADAGLAPAIEALGIAVMVAPTLMRSAEDRRQLARACIDFAAAIAERPAGR